MTPAFLDYALAKPRPCCSLVAVWVLSQLYAAPSDPTSDAAWRALDPVAWSMLNVWDAGQPWSATDAARCLLHGHLVEAVEVGRWHVVQRWNRDRTAGHTYLMMPLDSTHFRVVQSSERLGYRDQILPDYRRAGMEHRAVVVETKEHP